MVEIKKELDDDIVVIGLENKDFYVEVTNFSCTLLKAVVKDKEGNPCDCVLGFLKYQITRREMVHILVLW